MPVGVAVLGMLSACDRISSRRIEAIAADAKNAQQNGSETLLAGENIVAGTRIQTLADGHADLMLMPNLLLRLQENSELRITDLKFAADGNETMGGVRERAATVRLVRGRAIARVDQHGYNTVSLTFETPRGAIRATDDALFEIMEEPEATTITSIRGLLDIAPLVNRTRTLWPGETMVMNNTTSDRVTLPSVEQDEIQARCARAETTLQYEATAQMEARR